MIELDKFNKFCAFNCNKHKCKTCKLSEFVKWYNVQTPNTEIVRGWIK